MGVFRVLGMRTLFVCCQQQQGFSRINPIKAIQSKAVKVHLEEAALLIDPKRWSALIMFLLCVIDVVLHT